MDTSVSVLDLSYLRDLLSDDTVAMRELLKMALPQARHFLQEMDASAQKEQFPEIRERAHEMKGAFANLGAREIEMLCRQIEDAARGKDARISDLIARLGGACGRFETLVDEYVGQFA